MKEYIERDAAIRAVQRYGVGALDADDFSPEQAERFIISNLSAIPAGDVVEVRRGKWVWNENGVDWGLGAWECSECHRKPETWWEADKVNPYRCAGSSYCPNCGAKMTEV